MRVSGGDKKEPLIEQFAATEHERRARAYFRNQDFDQAMSETWLATAAWERVAELERTR